MLRGAVIYQNGPAGGPIFWIEDGCLLQPDDYPLVPHDYHYRNEEAE